MEDTKPLRYETFTAILFLGKSPRTLNFHIWKSRAFDVFVFVPSEFVIFTWSLSIRSSVTIVFIDFFIIKSWVFASVWFSVTVLLFHFTILLNLYLSEGLKSLKLLEIYSIV